MWGYLLWWGEKRRLVLSTLKSEFGENYNIGKLSYSLKLAEKC